MFVVSLMLCCGTTARHVSSEIVAEGGSPPTSAGQRTKTHQELITTWVKNVSCLLEEVLAIDLRLTGWTSEAQHPVESADWRVHTPFHFDKARKVVEETMSVLVSY